MTRIFDDEQTTSLVRAMANPESNARKMAEQNQEIGVPSDITNDILNKYATYGANTGIGNLGGNRLVEAINDQYRKKVDAPLQQESKEAFLGGFTELLAELGKSAKDFLTTGAETATETATETSIPSGISIPESTVPTTPRSLTEADPTALDEAINSPIANTDETRLDKFKKYLEENPVLAKQLGESAGTLGGILAKEAIGEDETERVISAPRPRFQPSRVRTPRIGMSGGGKPPEGSVLGRKLFLEGGEVDGPGGPKEDLVPIWASDKEYVMSHEAVKRMGGGDFDKGIATLDKINFGK
tara:strand:+ start:1333 stop:2232 length:900 start_codon:yes stop_codon:yes gene_type:complete